MLFEQTGRFVQRFFSVYKSFIVPVRAKRPDAFFEESRRTRDPISVLWTWGVENKGRPTPNPTSARKPKLTLNFKLGALHPMSETPCPWGWVGPCPENGHWVPSSPTLNFPIFQFNVKKSSPKDILGRFPRRFLSS